MEGISVLNRSVTTFDTRDRTSFLRTKISDEAIKKNQVPDKPVTEVDEFFLNYLNLHGLANEDNLLVLSSKLH